jgi:hypothetical protein
MYHGQEFPSLSNNSAFVSSHVDPPPQEQHIEVATKVAVSVVPHAASLSVKKPHFKPFEPELPLGVFVQYVSERIGVMKVEERRVKKRREGGCILRGWSITVQVRESELSSAEEEQGKIFFKVRLIRVRLRRRKRFSK